MNTPNTSKNLPFTHSACLMLIFLFAFSSVNAKEFIVTSTVDAIDSSVGDGDCNGTEGCTFRAAIMEANALPGSDTISLSNAIYTLSIDGIEENESATGDLDITEELIINGAGATIDAVNLDRIFDVHRVPVKIESLTLKNGLSEVEAGALRAIRSDLTLSNVNFTDNIASGVGGGLYAGGGKLTISNSNFQSNSSSSGGGLFIEHTRLMISGGSFIDNTAFEGGALNVAYPALFILTGTHFKDNASSKSGGAIYLEGTDAETAEQYIIESCRFTGNSSSGGVGGALYVEHLYGSSSSVEATLLVNSSTFRDGKALGGAAIWMNKSLLTVTGSTFTGNIAVDSVGGGIYSYDNLNVTNSTFTKNYTEDLGAAIYADEELIAVGVTAKDNTTFNQEGEGIYQRLNALLEDTDNDGTADNKDEFPLDKTEQFDTDDDGTGNNADTDDDGDGVADIDDPFPLDASLPGNTNPVTPTPVPTPSVTNNDIDEDGVLNEDDAFPDDPLETVDTDNDGIGNNKDTDDDGDGALDIDEIRLGSDPLSNIDTPENHRPSKPEIFQIVANANAPLTQFSTQLSEFIDPDETGKASSIEIVIEGPLDDGSSGPVFRRKLNVDQLQDMRIPDGLLDIGLDYIISFSYVDATGQSSEFSEPFTLKTVSLNPLDFNGDLINDSAEPSGEFDINNNNIDDGTEGISIVANAENGDVLGISSDIGQVSHLSVMRKSDLPEALLDELEGSMPLGLLGFRISGITPGSTVVVAVQSLIEIPADYRWYQYDPNSGLVDITALTILENKTVFITFVDGGAGDLDGVANGRVIDPGGPVFTLLATEPTEPLPTPDSNESNSSSSGQVSLNLLILFGFIVLLRGMYRNRIYSSK